MTKLQILPILESILGKYKQTGGSNYAFFCPYCKHHKQKLEINLDTCNYHCWTCSPKRGGRNFFYLIKDLNTANQNQLDLIREYTKAPHTVTTEIKKDILYLPDSFKSLSQTWNVPGYKSAMKYLLDRNISECDIIKYNIGFANDGEYEGRIIVPSYAADNTLNFFVARTFINSKLKYKNPKVSKNVVIFEKLISWNHPIVLVEGVFDAIAVKRNAIPILGKSLSPQLKFQLHTNRVKDIYVCLDVDAKEDAMNITKSLIGEMIDSNIYLVKLNKKDPSDEGFPFVNNIIYKTERADFRKLIHMRLFD